MVLLGEPSAGLALNYAGSPRDEKSNFRRRRAGRTSVLIRDRRRDRRRDDQLRVFGQIADAREAVQSDAGTPGPAAPSGSRSSATALPSSTTPPQTMNVEQEGLIGPVITVPRSHEARAEYHLEGVSEYPVDASVRDPDAPIPTP
jgi:hypothetical protein